MLNQTWHGANCPLSVRPFSQQTKERSDSKSLPRAHNHEVSLLLGFGGVLSLGLLIPAG